MTDNVNVQQIVVEIGSKNRYPSSLAYQIVAEIGWIAKTNNIFVRDCSYCSDSQISSAAIRVARNRWMSNSLQTGNIQTVGVGYD